MKALLKMLVLGLVEIAVFGLVLFGLAGTFDYWQAWAFLAVFALSTWLPSMYLLRTNPDALQRRKRAGPVAETRTVQKMFIAGWYSSLAAMVLVSTLDHRFGWSEVPAVVSVAGDVLVAVGLGITSLVVIQNSFAASTVQVESDQKLVDKGLYGLVRHPMYTGNVITIVGFPLALGSYWGLLAVIPGVFTLVLRIGDEEKMLTEELAGYRDYAQKARYRLVPLLW